MSERTDGRKVVRTAHTSFGVYEWEPERTDISLLKLSFDHASGQGSYIMRMDPGAETEWHTHDRREEYIIIEGDLVEPDGTVLGPGDVVLFEPGTTHNSRTETGCLIFAVEYSLTGPGVS